MPRVAHRTTGSRWPTNAPSWPGSAPGWRSSGAAWAWPAPGAARERTVLAWWRTALAATVVAVLFARLAGTRGVSGAGMLAVPGWLLMLAVARYRVRALRSGHDTPARSTPPLLGLAAVGIAEVRGALAGLPCLHGAPFSPVLPRRPGADRR